MRASTLNNYRGRIVWLQKVKAGEIIVDHKNCKYVASIKQFCKMKVDAFAIIAYNSLKSAASHGEVGDDRNDICWGEFKLLFSQAKDVVDTSIVSVAPVLPNARVLADLALLDAHICSMAYIELLGFLSSLAGTITTNPNLAVERIRIQLEISKAKFKSVISHASNYDGAKPGLTLIKK